VTLPDGTLVEGGDRSAPGGPCASLRIVRPRAIRRLFIGGEIGFAEAFMDGDWETPDLPGFLALVTCNEPHVPTTLSGLGAVRQFYRLRHRRRPNTRNGSRRNIAAHYDLGNAFYARWLDAGMTYSSALFVDPKESLERAQQNKYARLAQMIDLAEDQHVLEIGCGWGTFALYAARTHGCRVTALTLSREQADHARQAVAAAGLQDRIEVRLQDYRDVVGTYDRVVSIEMFEAVGEAFWSRFFAVVRERLRPGGVAGLQIISIDEARFAAYRRGTDFIQQYIFPGGMLPSATALREAVQAAGLQLSDAITFGSSYMRTLQLWRDRFVKSWPDIEALGFDARFRRMWLYYLAYCETGFACGTLDVGHYRIDNLPSALGT
jgi:cyclopropane-fatty-acyl-phospholipid synthase